MNSFHRHRDTESVAAVAAVAGGCGGCGGEMESGPGVSECVCVWGVGG